MKRGILLILALLLLVWSARADTVLRANCTNDLTVEIGDSENVTTQITFSFYNQGNSCGFQVTDYDPRRPDPQYYQYFCNPGLLDGKWQSVSLFVFENSAGQTIIGKRNFTFHATSNIPCGTVLIKDISYETVPPDPYLPHNNAVPEYTLIAAGTAMLGAMAGIVLYRRR